MDESESNPAAVAEIQGLYGPFTFPEHLLQKIWADGAFDQTQLGTTDGRKVRVRHPGHWNRLAGPDFKNARLQLGDAAAIVGDVELHLHAEDWAAHGHAADPAYRQVKLHVVLFPPRPGHESRDGAGRPIPVLALLPWLQHDLEEYAAEAAVAALANRAEDRVRELLLGLPLPQRWAMLRSRAQRRWRQKVHFAGLRVAKLGWTEACHQTALEILGYRYNRAPMLRLATRLPLPAWRELEERHLVTVADAERWNHSGSRPANHPRARLRQYRRWVRAVPNWPQLLLDLAPELPRADLTEATPDVRRRDGLRGWRDRIAAQVVGDNVGGSRLDTLACDGFWPLLAAQAGAPLAGLWWHWFPGDFPASFGASLRETGIVGRGVAPVSHGLVQGLIGWMLEQATTGAHAATGAGLDKASGEK